MNTGRGPAPRTHDLPAAEQEAGAEPDRLRILVADDEPTIRSVIGQVLRMDGHEPTLVGSAEEALATFEQTPFPLVITDIIMGRMNGLALLREIKQKAPDTLVVIMTSHASIESATTALREGAYDFLIKPFDDLIQISALANRAAERLRLEQRNSLLTRQLEMYARELERLNQDLRHAVDKDWLTGLYSRRYLRIALDAEIARARRYQRGLSLIMLDLDHFKSYNDTHGHLAGDDLLSGVAKVILDSSREGDVCARYGGEEFVMLLPETELAAARLGAERIRSRIEEHPFKGRETQPRGAVTASLGLATLSSEDRDANALIDRADRALYRAKEQGRNRVCE